MSFFTRLRRQHTAPGATVAEDNTERDDAAAPRGRSWWRHPVAARVVTVLAAVLVFAALVAPNQLTRLTPGAFVRIPVEGLLGAALLLVLPAKPRRIVAVALGVILGVLAVVKIVDMGFYSILARPFDPVLDWILFADAFGFVESSFGRLGAVGALIVAILLAAVVLTLMTLSVLRLTRVAVPHRTPVLRADAALAVVWLILALVGAQIVHGVPVASGSAAALVYDRAVQARDEVKDQEEFTAQSKVDIFHDTPGSELLTGLRGKDVILTFVESYGRSALDNPQVDATLDAGTRQLEAAGFAARSGYLTSPVAGAGSWLAHGTLLSGLKIKNQGRYDSLISGNRTTLTSAFQRAGWRTVAVMPGTIAPWPEAPFYGIDQVYAFKDLGYKGPNFSWATMPDQYALSFFERTEYAKPGRGPLMAEIVLVSSHAPWKPVPRMVDWNSVGDGSVFDSMYEKGDSPQSVLTRPAAEARADYAQSIVYSVGTLIAYLQKYGNANTVLVFLGDHQPAPIVTGEGASRDVPITIVAHDPAVLDRISGWGWQNGLRPGKNAPVWPMQTFRDRFLTAFGSTAAHAR